MSVGTFFKGLLFVVLVGAYIFSGGCALSSMSCMFTGVRCDPLLGLFFVPGFIAGGIFGAILAVVLSGIKDLRVHVPIAMLFVMSLGGLLIKIFEEITMHSANLSGGKITLMIASVVLLLIPSTPAFYKVIRDLRRRAVGDGLWEKISSLLTPKILLFVCFYSIFQVMFNPYLGVPLLSVSFTLYVIQSRKEDRVRSGRQDEVSEE